MKETQTHKNLKNKAQTNYPEKIIVHHTGGTDANPLADTSHHTARMVEKYHLSKGWEGIGYTYYIEKDGQVWKGRPEHYHGAHTKGQNTKSIGVCLAGNFDATLPTKQQVEALRSLLIGLMAKYDTQIVEPHRRYASKSCYGAKLDDRWAYELTQQSKQDACEPYKKEIKTLKSILLKLISWLQ